MIEAKRVPYGVTDFLRVIRENQYYVDKTMYIPLLEAQPDYLIFIPLAASARACFSVCSKLTMTAS